MPQSCLEKRNNIEDLVLNIDSLCLSCYTMYIDIREDIRNIFDLPHINGNWTNKDLKTKINLEVKSIRERIMNISLNDLANEIEEKISAVIKSIDKSQHNKSCDHKDNRAYIGVTDVNYLNFVTTLFLIFTNKQVKRICVVSR